MANAHLCASLLKIKAVAESPKLPNEIKNGVPRPGMSEEERAMLHNVTSGLYNQVKVRAAVDKAITDFCEALSVPVPDKKGKLKKGGMKAAAGDRIQAEEQLVDRMKQPQSKSDNKTKRQEKKDEEGGVPDARKSEEEEWCGFSDAEEDEETEEKAVARFDDRLGGSDSDDSHSGDAYDTANEELDPMEITDESASDRSDADTFMENGVSDEEDTSGTDESDESEDEEEVSDASAISPPPKARNDPQKVANTKTTDAKFLPSLMGGYVSGSESEASDIDVAPTARKNRRGQRARQAIWEKKFKEQAKHLKKQASERDDGWDLKRGAVDSTLRTPWKQGIKTPFSKKSTTANREGEDEIITYSQPKPQRKPPKKDDEGPLHPSWEAKRRAKEAQQTAAFQGKRVVFD